MLLAVPVGDSHARGCARAVGERCVLCGKAPGMLEALSSSKIRAHFGLVVVAGLNLSVPSVRSQSDAELHDLAQHLIGLYRAAQDREAAPIAEHYASLRRRFH